MRSTLFLLSFLILGTHVIAQEDSLELNQDAIYNRPFIALGKTRTAVGGYLEGNTNYFSEDGVSEGFSMELRRFNIFLYSPIGSRIRFLSELEFEHGTEEISLETAQLDFEVNSALNFRAGIVLPAIGLVNTNHDSPNWEFVERPLTSTGLIPTTLSEVGFGVHGKFYPSETAVISYNAYLVNGLRDEIILNGEGRTDLQSGKSPEMFAEDNNGEPMLNGRLSYAHRGIGEIGLSYYGGAYNTFSEEGEPVDEKRYLSVMAVDFSTDAGKLEIKGEGVMVLLEVPAEISEIYGERQYGAFADFIYPVLKRSILRFEDAVFNVALRVEYVDYNVGSFSTNIGNSIGDENKGVALGLGFRPRPGTVIRANYRYHLITDLLGNPDIHRAGFQFGVASYF